MNVQMIDDIYWDAQCGVAFNIKLINEIISDGEYDSEHTKYLNSLREFYMFRIKIPNGKFGQFKLISYISNLIDNTMWVLRDKNGKGYNPKTPYTQEEIKNNYLTNNLSRVAIYQYKGYAERLAKELGEFTVIDVNHY